MDGRGRSFKLDLINLLRDESFSGEYRSTNVKICIGDS